MRSPRRPALSTLLFLLAACSGGGGGGGGPTSSGFEPSASAWVYALTSPTITRYAADAATGLLIPEGHVPDFFHIDLSDLAVARGGESLYALDRALARIDVARVEPSTGALAKDFTHPLPSSFLELAIDAGERFLYARSSTELRTLAIDPASGALSDAGTIETTSGRELVLDPAGRFLFQLHAFEPEVLVFGVAADGTLTRVDLDPGTPDVQNAAVDPSTVELRVSHDGRLVAGSTFAETAVYALEPSGDLTRIAGAASEEASSVKSLVWGGDGTHVYSAHADGTLVTYELDAETGLLVRVDADPLTPGVQNFEAGSPLDVAELGPSGEHLVLALRPTSQSELRTYALDPANGLPGLPRSFPGLRSASTRRLLVAQRDTAALRAPRFLYLAGFDGVGPRIETYGIDPETGELSFLDTQPTPVAGAHLLADRANRFLYAEERYVAGFEVDPSTGLLASIGIVHGSSAAHRVIRAAVNPTGWATYAAVVPNRAGEDYAFNSYNTGLSSTLEPLGNWAQSIFGVPDAALGFAIGDVAIDPLGQTAFYANVTSVRIYPISVSNVVQPRLDASPAAGHQDFETGTVTEGLEAGPLGRFLLSTSSASPGVAGDKFLASFRIEPTGAITLAERLLLPAEPEDLVLHPRGAHAYLGRRDDTVSVYRVDEATGDLTLLQTVARGPRGSDDQYLAMDPSGRFLWLSTSEAGAPALQRWTIDPATGELGDLTTVATPPFTGSILVTGRFE